ncbi:hypothetical protein [Shouchella shacheensis]|uniref:hypothetical protein n=1 Tax=Shouchella shacheensis TaxID=1649580 RepID=UPI0012F9A3D7|nr:hypothetical protein [Shouchella shacheensis]
MIGIDITDLSVRIIFLFLPGIIGAVIIDILTTHRKRQVFNFVIHAYLIGIFSYGILHGYSFISNYCNFIISLDGTFLETLLNSGQEIQVWEVFLSTLVGISLALFLVFVISRGLVYKAVNAIRLSTSHGDSDVWEYIMASNDVQWINIRRGDLIYKGKVAVYSEKENIRELYLSDVDVYPEGNGELLYHLDSMYFNFNATEDFAVEIYGGGEETDREESGKSCAETTD